MRILLTFCFLLVQAALTSVEVMAGVIQNDEDPLHREGVGWNVLFR
jgi:hypothetical protein